MTTRELRGSYPQSQLERRGRVQERQCLKGEQEYNLDPPKNTGVKQKSLFTLHMELGPDPPGLVKHEK